MELRKLTRWQWTTIFALTVGYAGYYFCRSNLSVATPLILEQFESIDKKAMGSIASWGVVLYACGKLFNGVIGDFAGGRRMFLLGMVASIVATVAFGLTFGAMAFWVFLLVWCFNRLVQSMGWVALVKTASRWFPAGAMGTVVGILCLSFLFGDVAAKLVLGQFVEWGLGWRGVFFAAAGIFTVILVTVSLLLKSSPKDVGELEPPSHPDNVFGKEGDNDRPEGLFVLLIPFLTSVSFWLICVMNFGLTLVRETFNFWTPTYLVEAVGMSEGHAGMASSLFPFFGGLSVISAGFLSDWLAKGRRGCVMFIYLLPSAFVLFYLARLGQPESYWLPLVLISLTGFLMLGPYAFLSGCVSVDLGGKRGSATAAGIIDTVGYAGGILSGRVVGGLAQDYGWSRCFVLLACVLAAAAFTALVYWYVHEVHPARRAVRARLAPEASGQS